MNSPLPKEIQALNLQNEFKEAMAVRNAADKRIDAVTAKLREQEILSNPDLANLNLELLQMLNDIALDKPGMTIQRVITGLKRGIALAENYARYDSHVRMGELDLALSQIQEEANRPPGLDLPGRFGLKGVQQYIGIPTLVGGYTGLGKTTVLLNFLYQYMLEGKPAIFFSHEMTAGRIWARCFNMFLAHGREDSRRLPEIYAILGDESHPDRHLWDEFRERTSNFRGIRIIPAQGWRPADIRGYYEEHRRVHDQEPHALVDYFQRITPDIDVEKEDTRMKYKSIIDRLTDYANTTNAAWTIAVQENRTGMKDNRERNNGRTLYGAGDQSNFQETAALEQNAALCLSIGRWQDENKEWEPEIILRVNKNRDGRLKQSECEIDVRSGFIRGANVQ